MSKTTVNAEEIKKNLVRLRKDKKTGTQPYIDRSLKLRKLVNALFSQQKTSLAQIQKYITDNEFETTSNENQILYNILTCKQENSKILFNTKLLTKKLHLYTVGDGLKTRILTNDALFLAMTCNDLVNNDDSVKAYKDIYSIGSVKIISENFKFNDTEISGFIQDYDPDFSALAIQGLPVDRINEVINAKLNEKYFVYNGIDYRAFGDDSVFIITTANTNVKEIYDKYKDQQYLNNEDGKVQLGVKTISKTDKICFIDKLLTPESFCPAFLMSPEAITMRFLFELELDYNELYTKIEDASAEKLTVPENLCYWDTISQCFDFLCILGLTSQLIGESVKTYIGEMYKKYLGYRAAINKWKNNQLIFQRIAMDFLHGFINNSDYIRFVNLLIKTEKYIKERDKLKSSYNDALMFLTGLPFTQMIKNQMSDNVLGIADGIKEVLGYYVQGKKVSNLEQQIRSVAQKIYDLLPQKDMKDAAFPFIMAPGGLLGLNPDIMNGTFGTLPNVQKNIRKIKNQLKKENEEIKEIADYMNNKDQYIDDFLIDYINKREKFLSNKTKKHKNNIRKDILDEMKSNPDLSNYILQLALEYERKKKLPTGQKVTSLNKTISEYDNKEKAKASNKQLRTSIRQPQKTKKSGFDRELKGLNYGRSKSDDEEERKRSRTRNKDIGEEEEEDDEE